MKLEHGSFLKSSVDELAKQEPQHRKVVLELKHELNMKGVLLLQVKHKDSYGVMLSKPFTFLG